MDTTASHNATRLRVGAASGAAVAMDTQISVAFGNRYRILLDFELLESHMPFYQSSLGARLQYKPTFNDYSRVIIATADVNATYTINNISLDYDSVTQLELARLIRNQYMGHVSILYDRVLRHRKIIANKSDSLITIGLKLSARNMKEC